MAPYEARSASHKYHVASLCKEAPRSLSLYPPCRVDSSTIAGVAWCSERSLIWGGPRARESPYRMRSVVSNRVLRRYVGDYVTTYESDRIEDSKWSREQVAIASLVARIPAKYRNAVADVPCGTGRLIPLLSQEFSSVLAVDASTDMLAFVDSRFREQVDEERLRLLQASIESLPIESASVDIAVCLRLTNWLQVGPLNAAVKELARVSQFGVILGIRYWTRRSLLESRRNPRLLSNWAALKFGRQTRSTGRTVYSGARLAGIFADAQLSPVAVTNIESRIDGTTYVVTLLRHTK